MKIAAYFSPCAAQVSAIVDRMLWAQTARSWHFHHAACASSGSIGAVCTTEQFSSTSCCHQSAETGNQLFVAGVPLAPSVSARLEKIVALPMPAATAELTQMDGAFAAVLWNPLEQACVVVTDALGMQPLYMVRRPGLLALASEAKALTASGVVDYSMSPAGWGAFLSFHHLIAGLTLAESVIRVPPGAVLSFDIRSDHVRCRSHSEWPEPLGPQEIDTPFLDDLIGALLSDIRSCLEHHAAPTLLLSGGYDSRLLLAALSEMGIRPPVLTHDHAEELFGLESFLATRVAGEFGVQGRRLCTDPEYFSSSAYLDYLVASDVSVPSLYLFIAQMSAVLPPAIEAAWEGTFPGCMLFPIHQPEGSFDSYLARECASFDSPWWQAAAKVFAPELVAEMRNAFRECLSAEQAKYSDDEHGVSEFVVRNRTRHRIAINPLQVYSNDVLPLTPGLTRAFWTRAAAIPYVVKSGHALYRHLFRRYFTRATRVPVVSAGRFDPLDSPMMWGSLARSIAARLQTPRVERLLRRVGVRCGAYYWEPSRLVEAAVRDTCAGDPDLNRDEVIRLQQRPSRLDDQVTETARLLLFYRLTAQRVFTGTLTYATRGSTDAHRWVGTASTTSTS